MSATPIINNSSDAKPLENQQILDLIKSNPSLNLETLIKSIADYGQISVKLDTRRLSESDLKEPMLNPEKRKFTAFPLEYMDLWSEYKTQMDAFWRPEEIDFSNDYADFQTLNSDEQHFIKMILAFFAASDGIVNFNLDERFIREITVTEAQFAYHFQAMMEDVHSITYSLMLDNIVRDKDERTKLFNAIETVPSVKKMADWAFKWIESSDSYAHRLIAFAIIEGIFFSGAFAAIFWLKKQKTSNSTTGSSFMNGLVSSNDFISRDEGRHYTFACKMYKHVVYKLSTAQANAIVREGVDLAKEFILESIPVRLLGMNSGLMSQYIEYMGDWLLQQLGYKALYNSKNPFDFMKTIGMTNSSNFFEVRPTEYSNANTENNNRPVDIVLDDDF